MMNPQLPEPEKVSNVLLIAVDSLRYDTAYAEMPTLQQLGSSHIACHQYHTAGPGTPSSTAALMQSRQPVEHDGHGMELSPERQTLAEALNETGVSTAGWHENAFLTEKYGFPRGFDEWHDYDTDGDRKGGDTGSLRERLGTIADTFDIRDSAERAFNLLIQTGIADADLQTDMERFVDDALNWLQSGQQQFVYLHPMDVHLPYIPPADYRNQDVGDLYDIWSTLRQSPSDLSDEEVAIARHGYRNEARYVDDQLARLVEMLKRREEWDDTALIVTADHGELFRDRKTPEPHALKHINYLCEELTHVPFVIAGGSIPEATITSLTSAIDVAPTVAYLLGATPSSEWFGYPVWDSDIENRAAIVSSTMNTHGRGVEVIPERLHISVRTPERTILWWADDTPTEYFNRTTAGEVRVNSDRVTAEREHTIRRDVEERADKVNQDSEVGGEVTERLRDLGYVEGGDT